MSSANHYVLTFACPDRPGIVHGVSGAVVEAAGNITESNQFTSQDTGRFFMRLQVESLKSIVEFEEALQPVVEEFDLEHTLDIVSRPTRTLVLVSSTGHTLNDLLFRQRSGNLSIEVPLILGNHPNLASLARFYGIPFESRAIESAGAKAEFEDRILEVVDDNDIELVVLARFMRVLSPELCERLSGRIINIHHSFLPGFKGANPYRQAHSRGVKLIGATAHFATAELDEGPIIQQNVVRVDHADDPEQLRSIGENEESRTLSQAVALFSEHRILLDGKRTIVFS